MKLKFLLSLQLMLIANIAMAGKITESQALAIAKAFVDDNIAMSKSKITGASSLKTAHASTGYYAFNRGESNGFVLVSASDMVVNNVFGYADNGNFDAENIPENMRWWLSEYDRQIEYLEANPTLQTKTCATTTSYSAIEPLITTRWGQESPYNLSCPIIDGTNCLTGCNATAIAQIMNYYEYPTTGTESKTYTDTGSNQELTVDFSQSTYDWANMTDGYDTESTDEQKAAVAKLMYDIGVAVETIYGTRVSLANSINGIQALYNYFGYDKGMNLYPRDAYDVYTWESMMHDNLANNQPILYGGNTSDGSGHTFVIDGYDGNGKFHVNWGWSGYCDGYFILSALNALGDDVTGYQYNYNQDAVLGIKPAEESSSFSQNIYCLDDFSLVNNISSVLYFGNNFVYYGLESVNCAFGVKAVDSSTETVSYLNYEPWGYPYSYSNSGSYYSDFAIPEYLFQSLSDGVYYVYPVFKSNTNDIWQDIVCYNNEYLMANVSSGTVNFYNSIIDEHSENTITAATDASVLLLRTLSSEYWNTFCVPFDISAEQIASTFGEGTTITKFNGTVVNQTMYFDQVTSIEAGVPYLIKPSQTVSDPLFEGVTIVEGDAQSITSGGYGMTGVYNPTTLATDGTNLFLTQSGKLSQPATSTNIIYGLRAYIIVPSGVTSARINIAGETTGISDIDVSSQTATDAIYTIGGNYAGKDASGLANGLYIVKGKKVIIKK